MWVGWEDGRVATMVPSIKEPLDKEPELIISFIFMDNETEIS